jgi:hypothetical protein
LPWVAGKKALDPLFEFTAISDITSEFIDWICDKFVSVNDDEVFALIERKGPVINPWFVFALAVRLSYRDPMPTAEAMSRWVPILIEYGTYLDRHDLSEMVARCLSLGADTAAIQLFEFLTSPRLDLKKPLIFPGDDPNVERKSDVELGFSGDNHLSHETWTKHFPSRLDKFAKKLWPGLIRNLHASFQLLKTWGKATPDGDPISWHRTAIEPHEQDQYPNDIDLLINAARDCLDWALENDPALAKAWIESLMVSESKILRRIAIHGIANSKTETSDDKLIWIMDNNLFITTGLKHEIFRLLSVAYPHSQPTTKVRFLEETFNKIDARPIEEDTDQERNEYQKFNLLSWLIRFAPDCEELNKRLTTIRNKHPNFEAREHPDLSHWIQDVRNIGVSSPVAVEELLAKSPYDLVEYYLEFQGDWFDRPNRDGMLTTVDEAVQKNFEWSKGLTEVLIERDLWFSDLWGSIIRAWSKSTLNKENWDYILTVLENQNLLRAHQHSISDLLQDGVQKEENSLRIGQYSAADNVANMLWGVLDSEELEEKDWLRKAINRPGGKLAFFWLHALSKVCKQGEACVKGIPQPYRQRLDVIVTGSNSPSILGRVVLAGQIGFFFDIDPEWTKEKLLPLLDWNIDANQAQQAWEGWLSWGWGKNEQLLNEIKQYYLQAFSHLDAELSNKKDGFIQHIIQIALYWINNPIEGEWIPKFLRFVSEKNRVLFAQQMNSFLMKMKDETKKDCGIDGYEAIWNVVMEAFQFPILIKSL